MATPTDRSLPPLQDPGDLEGRLQRLARFSVDCAPDPIFWISPTAKVLYVNDAACRVLAYSRQELVGQRICDIDPNFPPEAWGEHWSELQAKGSLTFESDHWTKDGRLLRTEVTANLIRHEGHEYNCAIMRDITARKTAEETLRRQLDQLSALSVLAEHLNTSPSLEQMYEATMGGFERALGVHRMAILLRDADGVVRFKAWRDLSATYRGAVEGHSFWSLDDPDPKLVVVTNVAADPSAAAFRNVALEEGILALVAVPLVVRKRVIGKCMLYFSTPRSLSGSERRLAETIARHVAFAVERKKSETEIWTAGNLLRAIVDATPDAIYAKDTDGRYVLFNPASARLVGKRATDVVGATDAAVFRPDTARAIMEVDRQIITTRTLQTQEEIATTVDGHLRSFFTTKGPLFDEHGAVYGIFGISRDITEEQQARERLRHSEARFRSLIQNSSDVTTLLSDDGTIQYESPAFYRLTGWTEAEVLGRGILTLVHPDDCDRAIETFATALRSPGPTQFAAFRFRKADGLYLTLEVVCNSQLDDPNVAGVVMNSRDITERVRLEEQLRQAQKMEAIGRLTGGIAHDFNNLLMVIEGYCESALRTSDLSADLRIAVQEIRRAAMRAAQLTRQLLTFGRRRVLDPSPIDLNSTVLGLVGMLRRLIGENIRLETPLSASTDRVKIDVGQLEQVIMNLAINARDAMPNGGTLTIETRSSGPSQVALVVRDTGRGMDAATVSRVFEPFFTTKEPGQGTGLGMATVYGIVNQHGGTIQVDSAPGAGTSITITFPRAVASDRPGMPDTTECGAVAAGETVLLVEDEDMVRTLVRQILVGRGYRVLDAPNGETALQVSAAQDAGGIHLLLTDMVMPGMSGRVLAEHLLDIRPSMKVVFMSGYTDDVALRGEKWEGVPLLRKPFDSEALGRAVQQAFASESA